jgi:formylmethanofuran dehydrogenase subunit E
MNVIDPHNISLKEMIDQGTEFHGHLGPFLVLGIRMGLLALKDLSSSGHKNIEARVKTGTTPPISCLVDGIQISTGCTMGKGNITTEPLGLAEATFIADGNRATFKVRDDILKEMASSADDSLEMFAWDLSKRSDEDLFLRL